MGGLNKTFSCLSWREEASKVKAYSQISQNYVIIHLFYSNTLNRFLSTLRMLLAMEECITRVMIVIPAVIQLGSLMKA